MNSWISGLKEYNKGSNSWCIPKKGSQGYNYIMNKIKPVTSKEIQERGSGLSRAKEIQARSKEIQESRQKATKQAKEGSKIIRNQERREKPLTFKEIQEFRQKATKQAKEGSRQIRNRVKKILFSNNKEPSKPVDFAKEKKEQIEIDKKFEENYKRIHKKKKSGVLL